MWSGGAGGDRNFRSGGARASDPVFFEIEKHHGVGNDSSGILLVAEIDLALDTLCGGVIKVQIRGKGVVSQWAILCSSVLCYRADRHVLHVLIGCELLE